MTLKRNPALSSGSGLMVWKSNELVRTAAYEMTTRELKLLVVAISRIQQRSHDAFGPVVVTVRELAELLELKCDAVYSDIKAMAETLTGRVVRLHDPETKTHKWTNWCDVVYVEGSGCVQILFRNALKTHLLQLAEYFVRYGLDNILRLSSGYHIRLYEFLKSWESFGRPRVVALGELRRILGAEAKKGYDQYFVLNGSVLKPAAEAINKFTDVRFHYRPVKQGRTVSAVQFTIKSLPQPELPFGELAGALPLAGASQAADPVGADALSAARRSAPPDGDLFLRVDPLPPAGGQGAAQTTLGREVIAYWNERMFNSPIADTGSDRLKEVGRQITGDDYLRANWREAIDAVSESKVWNGRGHRGRDGQPFYASFRWFQEHVSDVADAAAARRRRLERKRAPKPSSSPSQAEVSPDTSSQVDPAEVAAGLRKLRRKLKRPWETSPDPAGPPEMTPVPPPSLREPGERLAVEQTLQAE